MLVRLFTNSVFTNVNEFQEPEKYTPAEIPDISDKNHTVEIAIDCDTVICGCFIIDKENIVLYQKVKQPIWVIAGDILKLTIIFGEQ